MTSVLRTAKSEQLDIAKAATLLARMQPHLAQGMTFQQAGEAVLMRDYELLAAVSTALRPGNEVGQAFVSEMAAQVYNEINN